MIQVEMRSIFLDPLASALLLWTLYSFFLCVSECMLLGSFIGFALYSFVYTYIKSTCCAHFLHLCVAPLLSPHSFCLNIVNGFFWCFCFFVLLFFNRLHIFILFSNMKYILSINRYSPINVDFPISVSSSFVSRSIWILSNFFWSYMQYNRKKSLSLCIEMCNILKTQKTSNLKRDSFVRGTTSKLLSIESNLKLENQWTKCRKRRACSNTWMYWSSCSANERRCEKHAMTILDHAFPGCFRKFSRRNMFLFALFQVICSTLFYAQLPPTFAIQFSTLASAPPSTQFISGRLH